MTAPSLPVFFGMAIAPPQRFTAKFPLDSWLSEALIARPRGRIA